MDRRPPVKRLVTGAVLCMALAACSSTATSAQPATPPTATATAAAAAGSTTPASAAPASPTATPKPAVLPGDSWLAFQGDTGSGVYGVRLVRPDGTGLFFPTDTADGTEQLHPDWSPDGTKLVFSTLGTAARDLWVTDADGGNPQH